MSISPRAGAVSWIAGRYRVLERLGSGQFGTVYRVEDVQSGPQETRTVALTVLRPVAASEASIARLKAEFLAFDFGDIPTATRSLEYAIAIAAREDLDPGGIIADDELKRLDRRCVGEVDRNLHIFAGASIYLADAHRIAGRNGRFDFVGIAVREAGFSGARGIEACVGEGRRRLGSRSGSFSHSTRTVPSEKSTPIAACPDSRWRPVRRSSAERARLAPVRP